MNDSTIMTGLAFLVAMVTILVPVLTATNKLNANIARLTEALDNLEENWKSGHATLEDRVATHGTQIDELEKVAINHDVRIKNLEGTHAPD